jgi:hypothetical protein
MAVVLYSLYSGAGWIYFVQCDFFPLQAQTRYLLRHAERLPLPGAGAIFFVGLDWTFITEMRIEFPVSFSFLFLTVRVLLYIT